MFKICARCKEEKDEVCFSASEFKKNSGRCKLCVSDYNKEYQKQNKSVIKIQRKAYYDDNKEILLGKHQEYYKKNKKELCKQKKVYYKENKQEILLNNQKYYENNKVNILKYHNEYYKYKHKDDLSYRLRKLFSSVIFQALKNNNTSKNNESCMKYLPYSIAELKIHLENKFETWMTWENWGKYNKNTWSDNDQSTWTWQIDHIMPQSDLLYTSMEDDNFKRCWALENLRPYSAKLNLIDGNRRKYDIFK